MLRNTIKDISNELWMMIASTIGDTTKIQILIQQPVNWDILLRLAIHHRVYPLVYITLSQLNKPVVPEHFIKKLREKYQENAINALSMAGETVRIVKCLENNEIYTVVLKGVPLAWYLYGDIGIRPSNDIDILVPPNELEKTIRILENEGYCRIYSEYILTPRQLKIYLKSAHSNHFLFWNRKKNIYLEIHWEFGNHVKALPLPLESNIKRLLIAGNPLPVLSDEEWLLYLILHGAGHGWYRLRWLFDIVKLTQQKDIDWGRIAFLANGFGMQSFLHQYFILASQILAVPVPPVLRTAIASDRFAWRLAYMSLNMFESVIDYRIRRSSCWHIKNWPKLYQFYVLTGSKNRFKYILKEIFIPEIEDIKFISLPDSLYALYYLISPITLIGRYLQRIQAEMKYTFNKKLSDKKNVKEYR